MSTRVSDWMQHDVRTVSADLPLEALEARFLEDRVSGYPVVSSGGELLGIVSRSDVVRQLSVENTWAEAMSDEHRDWGADETGAPSAEEVGELAGRRLAGFTVADLMEREPVVVPPDESLREAARVLVERRIHRVPVVQGKKLVGILSSLDVARFVARGNGPGGE